MIKPKIIKLNKYNDNRGFFQNVLDTKLSEKLNLNKNLLNYQISISNNKKGVLRGLHYQTPMQNKLVYLMKGKIQDFVVNIDKKSKEYGKTFEFILNKHTDLLFIPKKFAHGFYAIEESVILYVLDKNYNPKKEITIHWNDKFLNLKWRTKKPIISNKDSKGVPFN